jgi:hypothetical protein
MYSKQLDLLSNYCFEMKKNQLLLQSVQCSMTNSP